MVTRRRRSGREARHARRRPRIHGDAQTPATRRTFRAPADHGAARGTRRTAELGVHAALGSVVAHDVLCASTLDRSVEGELSARQVAGASTGSEPHEPPHVAVPGWVSCSSNGLRALSVSELDEKGPHTFTTRSLGRPSHGHGRRAKRPERARPRSTAAATTGSSRAAMASTIHVVIRLTTASMRPRGCFAVLRSTSARIIGHASERPPRWSVGGRPRGEMG